MSEKNHLRSRILLALAVAGTALVSAVAQQQDSAPAGPLVTRDQVKLNLAGAQVVLQAAQAQARQMNLAVNIAVSDDGGHLLAFARMDAARPASIYTALTKANAAATLRRATGPLRPTETPDAVHLNLSVENAAARGGGSFTTLYGGVPIVLNGQVIGSVGVGGATGEQDAQIAQAGIDALLKQIAGQ